MSTPLSLLRLTVDPFDGPDDGGQLCALIDRANLFTPGHWEAPMTTDGITRHYDAHIWDTAGDDLPRVWDEHERAAPWELALVWGGALIGSAVCWYAVLMLVKQLWERLV